MFRGADSVGTANNNGSASSNTSRNAARDTRNASREDIDNALRSRAGSASGTGSAPATDTPQFGTVGSQAAANRRAAMQNGSARLAGRDPAKQHEFRRHLE